MSTLNQWRNAEQIRTLVDFYNHEKINFQVKHSQYSTTIVMGKDKLKFMTNTHNKRVFMVSQQILKCLNESPLAQEIIKGDYSTRNYDLRWGLKPKKYGNIINIDIKAAYPKALLNAGLITQEIYKKLMRLDKFERLPAFGMLAKKATVFTYENGECSNWDVETGKYAQIFYFIITQIENLMQELKDIAGDYYLFHWVDGIFLEQKTPLSIIDKILSHIKRQNHFFSFETINECYIEREDTLVSCRLIKNGKEKEFKFADRNMLNLYNEILDNLEGDTIHLQRNATFDLQLPEGNEGNDLPL